MSAVSPPALRWTPYAAAAWAAVFAVFHFIWAAGWYVGLNRAEAARAFAKTGTLIYDLVVAAMCVVAVVVVLALEMHWGRRLPRRQLRRVLIAGTALLGVRAVASIAQLIYIIASKGRLPRPFSPWEPWFWAGATLFMITVWRHSTSQRSSSDMENAWDFKPHRSR